MPLLRRSRLPGLLLQLVLGFAVLLPELAHGLAHRVPGSLAAVEMDDHGHRHGHPHESAPPGVHYPDGMIAVGEQDTAAHEHFELSPIAPSKPTSPVIRDARSVVACVFAATLEWSPPTFRPDQLTIALRNHGPPPPSRAPPLS